MTSLTLISGDQLEVGDRFRFAGVEHTVTSIDRSVGLIHVTVDDRPSPVTLLPGTLVTLIRRSES